MKLLHGLPLFGFGLPVMSQVRGAYFSFAAGADIIKNSSTPAFGAHLSANRQLIKGVYLGVELGAVKIGGYRSVYIPPLLKLTAIPIKDKVSEVVAYTLR